MSELQDRTNNAIGELVQWIIDNPGENASESDVIWELADQAVPIYTGDILQCALDNIELAVVEPEGGSRDNSPVAVICANIFEYIEAELSRVWYEVEEYRLDRGWHEATYYLDVTSEGKWSIYRSSGDLPSILPNQWKAGDFWGAYRLIIQDAIDWELDEIEIVWQKNQPNDINARITRESSHMTKLA